MLMLWRAWARGEDFVAENVALILAYTAWSQNIWLRDGSRVNMRMAFKTLITHIFCGSVEQFQEQGIYWPFSIQKVRLTLLR